MTVPQGTNFQELTQQCSKGAGIWLPATLRVILLSGAPDSDASGNCQAKAAFPQWTRARWFLISQLFQIFFKGLSKLFLFACAPGLRTYSPSSVEKKEENQPHGGEPTNLPLSQVTNLTLQVKKSN